MKKTSLLSLFLFSFILFTCSAQAQLAINQKPSHIGFQLQALSVDKPESFHYVITHLTIVGGKIRLTEEHNETLPQDFLFNEKHFYAGLEHIVITMTLGNESLAQYGVLMGCFYIPLFTMTMG